jgi:hypothetical protein
MWETGGGGVIVNSMHRQSARDALSVKPLNSFPKRSVSQSVIRSFIFTSATSITNRCDNAALTARTSRRKGAAAWLPGRASPLPAARAQTAEVARSPAALRPPRGATAGTAAELHRQRGPVEQHRGRYRSVGGVGAFVGGWVGGWLSVER